ncbi:unnamed protein product [Trichobilharzia szidati]|nr:unnamed protein product [Trichobilharzia szidati]
MTALLLCHLTECKPSGSHGNCNIQKQYELCVTKTKDGILNRESSVFYFEIEMMRSDILKRFVHIFV